MLTNKKTNIYTQLSNKYNIPYQVIEVICNSPFKFAKKVIGNEIDYKPIMFAYLFKLKLKKKYEQSSSIIPKNGMGNTTKTI